jgi:hypothetical protein
MAASTVTVSNEGRLGVVVNPSLLKLTVTSTGSPYYTAMGGFQFDLTAVLNSAGPFSAPINPLDVVGILPAMSTSKYLVLGFQMGRYTPSADGTVSTVTPTAFTSASSTFTASDTGNYISIPGAGPGGAVLVSKMTYVSATAVTLTTPASTSVTTAYCWIGCPAYQLGNVEGSVTRYDSNVTPQQTLISCPCGVHLYDFNGASNVSAELGDGATAANDTLTFHLIINRGGTNA